MSDGQDVQPTRPFPGSGGPWNNSNRGSRSNSEGLPPSAVLVEQQSPPPRARYKSFQSRRELSVEAVPERPQVDPSVARLAAAAATQEIVRVALSVFGATQCLPRTAV